MVDGTEEDLTRERSPVKKNWGGWLVDYNKRKEWK